MNWRKEEIDYLKANYPNNPNMKEISNKLKKTVRAIQHKAIRMDIARPRFPSNKKRNRQPKKIIDKRYYERHSKDIYKRKIERIRNFREELKMMSGGKCNNCGYDKCFAALEFHHYKENKEIALSILIKDFSKQKSLKEAKKCILLCANCHRELHHKGL